MFDTELMITLILSATYILGMAGVYKLGVKSKFYTVSAITFLGSLAGLITISVRASDCAFKYNDATWNTFLTYYTDPWFVGVTPCREIFLGDETLCVCGYDGEQNEV